MAVQSVSQQYISRWCFQDKIRKIVREEYARALTDATSIASERIFPCTY